MYRWAVPACPRLPPCGGRPGDAIPLRPYIVLDRSPPFCPHGDCTYPASFDLPIALLSGRSSARPRDIIPQVEGFRVYPGGRGHPVAGRGPSGLARHGLGENYGGNSGAGRGPSGLAPAGGLFSRRQGGFPAVFGQLGRMWAVRPPANCFSDGYKSKGEGRVGTRPSLGLIASVALVSFLPVGRTGFEPVTL